MSAICPVPTGVTEISDDPCVLGQEPAVAQDVGEPPGIHMVGGPADQVGPAGTRRSPAHTHSRSAAARVMRRWRWSPRATPSRWVPPPVADSTNSSTTVVSTDGSSSDGVDAEHTFGRVDLDPGPWGAHRADAGERHLAHRPGVVFRLEADPPTGVTVGPDPDDRPEGGVEQVDHVGPEVEQRAPIEPPWGREHPAEKPVGQEVAPPPDRTGRRHRVQEGADVLTVAPGEQQLGGDPGRFDCVGQRLCGRQVEGERLLEQECFARQCRNRRHPGLDVGRDGERHRVDVFEEPVEGVVHFGGVGRGHLLGGHATSGPYRRQDGARVPGEHRRVHKDGPGTRSDDADAERRRSGRGGDHGSAISRVRRAISRVRRAGARR